jgi:UDP-N-acetylmuramate dehydrogenase
VAATVFDLLAPATSPRRLPNSELAYGYRTSAIRPTDVVLGAEFRLQPGLAAEGRRAIREIVRWRREHQPGGQNAGSVFTNPAGDSAGRLVEAAGFKGFRLGTAAVSDKHANFIQADAGGSADDVLRLLLHVRREVADRLGVLLEPEVRLVGFADGEGGNL